MLVPLGGEVRRRLVVSLNEAVYDHLGRLALLGDCGVPVLPAPRHDGFLHVASRLVAEPSYTDLNAFDPIPGSFTGNMSRLVSGNKKAARKDGLKDKMEKN